MAESLEGGFGPSRAVTPMEEEEEHSISEVNLPKDQV
jgi:hypothetical protein